MNEYKGLSRFLIIRFLQITVITALIEAVIFHVVNDIFLAAIFEKPLGISDVAIILLILMIRALSIALESLLSIRISTVFEYLISRIFPVSSQVIGINDISFERGFFIWLSLFLAMVVVIIPYAVAAIVFSRIVLREVRTMEELDRKKAAEYEQNRNLMLSDIAHDLRTPITTIAGYAKALDDDLITDDRKKEIYATIQSKSYRLSELIDLLFEYVKLDSAGYELKREKTDIYELLRETVAYCYQDIEEAGMELDTDIPEETLYINADKMQMERVITNLITNAVKHNPTGTRIGVFAGSKEGTITIRICDSGERIDDRYAGHIFDPFVTTDESRQSKNGTGLGLSIVKKILDMHGYGIVLKQKEDKDYNKQFIVTI